MDTWTDMHANKHILCFSTVYSLTCCMVAKDVWGVQQVNLLGYQV